MKKRKMKLEKSREKKGKPDTILEDNRSADNNKMTTIGKIESENNSGKGEVQA